MDEHQPYSQPMTPPPPPRQYVNYSDSAPVMTVGNWIVTMLIMCIPIVNIIMLIVWAASSSENPNRKNWAVAQIIFIAIGILLWILLAGVIVGAMGSLSNAFSS